MVIYILSMDTSVVGLRLPKLLILIAALWTVTPGRQLQTFVPTMSEERIIPMQFSLLSFVSLFPVDVGILAFPTNTDNHFPSAAAIYLTEFKM